MHSFKPVGPAARVPTDVVRRIALLLFTVAAAIGLSACTVLSRQDEALAWSLCRGDSQCPHCETTCQVHGLSTTVQYILVKDGLVALPQSYLHARLRRFPNSFWEAYSGSCMSSEPSVVQRWVCAACRAEELCWRSRHGWPVPAELPTPPTVSTFSSAAPLIQPRFTSRLRLTPACSGLATLAADARR